MNFIGNTLSHGRQFFHICVIVSIDQHYDVCVLLCIFFTTENNLLVNIYIRR